MVPRLRSHRPTADVVYSSSDYIGISDQARAQIQMNYDAAGPTVSPAEARRLEEESAKRLLADRKLILIVDLDQTIVHAAVEPTIGEWIAQGQAYDQAKAAREAKAKARTEKTKATKPDDGDDGDDRESSSDESEDDAPLVEPNPNWAMLKDVARFKLGPDPPTGSRRLRKPAEARDDGCDYYIKPRYVESRRSVLQVNLCAC